jgi:hypothetical protein
MLMTVVGRGSMSVKNITAAARGPTFGGKLAVRNSYTLLSSISIAFVFTTGALDGGLSVPLVSFLDILLVFFGAAILYSFTTSLLLWLQPPTLCTPLAISHDGGVGVLHIISFVLWRLQGSPATCRVLGGRLYHLFLTLVDFAKEETRQEGIKSAI